MQSGSSSEPERERPTESIRRLHGGRDQGSASDGAPYGAVRTTPISLGTF